jgi:hypothetical protein
MAERAAASKAAFPLEVMLKLDTVKPSSLTETLTESF